MNNAKLNTLFLSIMTLIAFGAIAKLTQSVLQPLILAFLLHFTVVPIISALEKVKVPRFASISVVLVLIFLLLYVLGTFFYSSVMSFVAEFPKYQETILNILDDFLNRFQIPTDILKEFNWASTLSGLVVDWSSNFMSFLGALGIVLIFFVFVALEAPYFETKIKKAFHIDTSTRIFQMAHDINHKIGRYLSIKVGVSAVTGLSVFFVLKVLGMDFAPIWGMMAFLFNFIPNIGSIFVVFFTGLFAIVQFYPEWKNPIVIFFGVFSIQLTVGNFIEPKLQGDRLDISPLLILVGLLFWGWLWGIVGMILSVPLMVIIKIVSANVDAFKPISVLMGTGRDIQNRILKSKKKSTNPN